MKTLVLTAALAGALANPALAQMRAADIPQPVLLAGRPFPNVTRYVADLPKPRLTTSLAAGETLQHALCRVKPGEGFFVPKGKYPGDLTIDGNCRGGTADKAILVVFEKDAVVEGSIAIRRSHWHVSGAQARGITIEKASSISIDSARIPAGTEPAIRIGKRASKVTISNATIGKRSVGIRVEGGVADVALVNNRIRAASVVLREASNVRLTGNVIRDAPETAILAERVSKLQIRDNTLFAAESGDTRGIDLAGVDGAVVRSNQLTGFATALILGARDVTVERNHFETSEAGGIGVAAEAGNAIRLVNNVINGYADAILLLGKRPSLSNVTVANNLVVAVSRTAFAIRDRASAALFDYNVFSPVREGVEVDVGGATMTLASYLARATMPHTTVTRVMIFDHDLARLGGIEAIDRGTPIDGLSFTGKAPDLGVAER